jgi:hypothetical protein
MTRPIRRPARLALTLAPALLAATLAGAQTPEVPRGTGTPAAAAAPTAAPARPARESFADLPPPHSSILRLRPWHEEFVPQEQRAKSYGFRNPGGVGRMAEYYPPGDQFQNNAPAHITARTGQGGGAPDRSEQLQAQSVGTARYSALQSHIDTYGRPMMGFGMGFGFGW